MPTSTQYMVLAGVLTLSLLTIAQAIRSYRRLSHIPGPPLATISRLWLLKGLIGTRNHLNLFEASLKYGPLARIGPNHVLTSDPEFIRRINAPRSPYRRSRWSEAMRLKPGVDNVLSERNEDKHDELRKKMAAGYAGKENPRLESEIDERIRDLIDLIERKYVCTDEEPARQLDLAEKTQFLTLDIISGLAFDQPFGDLIVDEDKFDYIKTVEQAMRVIMPMTELLEVRSVLEKSSLMKFMAPSATDSIGLGKVIGLAKGKVAERFGENRKVRQDMLGSFLRHGLSREEAESESVLQILAGSDTTATAIRVIFLFVITTPRVLWRLRAEMDEAMDNGLISSPIQDHEARTLPYLQACIKEGLRMFPPVTGLVDKVVPPEGDTINGVFLPGGTEVGYCAWGIHRSTIVFGPDANIFRPERWLDVPEPQLQKMERNNELIFGHGRFKCLGKNVAFVELNKIFVEYSGQQRYCLESIDLLLDRFQSLRLVHSISERTPNLGVSTSDSVELTTMPPNGKRKANPTRPLIDASDANPTLSPIDTSNANPQKESPLFVRIPGEIRDHIFNLALTAYPGKQEPFPKNSYYHRPGFRYADQKLDTELLRTCRRIYQEACHIPYRNYEPVEWHHQPGRGPPPAKARNFLRANASCPWVASLHLLTQQYWLEDSSWRTYARNLALRRREKFPLRRLKITIRHSDWWWWETSDPLLLDAKHKGTASARRYSAASHGFHVESWGHQFLFFKGLKTFELELETVEGKRKELDEIVIRAADWRFPLGDDNVLVLNPARTKRTGWHGMKLPTGVHVPSDAKEAKERLMKDGVDFTVWDGEAEISDEDCLTYYVVSLTYEAQRGQDPA